MEFNISDYEIQSYRSLLIICHTPTNCHTARPQPYITVTIILPPAVDQLETGRIHRCESCNCEQQQSKTRLHWHIFPIQPDFGNFHIFRSSTCNFAFSISKPTFLPLSASSAVRGPYALCFYNKHLFSYYACFFCVYNYPKCISSLFIKFFSYFMGKN